MKSQDKKRFLELKDEESHIFKDYFLNDKSNSSMWDEDNYINENNQISRDWVYMYQDKLAFRTIKSAINRSGQKYGESSILDVGSNLYTALFLSELCPVSYLEPRLNELSEYQGIESTFPWLCMNFIHGEAQSIPVENNSYDIVTSLHAVEHFGLGRYGDTIDYYGDQKGIREFNRVLKPDGGLVLSVPTSENDPRIEFNGQRIYNPDMIDEILDNSGFEIVYRYYIVSLGLNTKKDEKGNIVQLEPMSKDREVLKNVGRNQQAVYFTVSKKR